MKIALNRAIVAQNYAKIRGEHRNSSRGLGNLDTLDFTDPGGEGGGWLCLYIFGLSVFLFVSLYCMFLINVKKGKPTRLKYIVSHDP